MFRALAPFLVCLAAPTTAFAQRVCHAVDLGSFSASPRVTGFDDALGAVAGLTLAEGIALRATGETLAFPSLRESFLESARQTFRDADSNALAEAFAFAMQGMASGYSEDQAHLAALLYAELGLPTTPAVSLLISLESPSAARRRALIAIRRRMGQQELSAVISTLCIIGARAEGVSSLVDSTGSNRQLFRYLDRVDRELTSSLLNALSVARREGKHVQLSSVIREGSLLAEFVRTRYSHLR